MIELFVTYLLGETVPWISFFGEAPDFLRPWSFDVTCRDAVLGRRVPDIVCHLIASDSTAFECCSLLHFEKLSRLQKTTAATEARRNTAPAVSPLS